MANLSYVVGSGTALPFDDGAFDAVIFHTVLSHIPDAGGGAGRGGAGDRGGRRAGRLRRRLRDDHRRRSATTTRCRRAPMPRWRRWCTIATSCAASARSCAAAGWEVVRLRSHGYVENEEPGYILTLIDRGADTLVAAGRLGEPAAEALKAEARRRVAAGEFFGHIAYASLIARRP